MLISTCSGSLKNKKVTIYSKSSIVPWKTTRVPEAALPIDPHPASHPATNPAPPDTAGVSLTHPVQGAVAQPGVGWLPGKLGGGRKLKLLSIPSRVIFRIIPVFPPLAHCTEIWQQAEE